MLSCTDSDQAIRALLNQYPDARNIEISGAGLEEAFLALTGEADDTAQPGQGARPMNTTYYKYEVLRIFRNRQNFIFSMILPVILYVFIAGQNRGGEVRRRCPCRPTSWPA